MNEPFRFQPRLPVNAYRTFQIAAPVATHFKQATCEQIQCDHHVQGWLSAIDERTELGQSQAYYIRNSSGRRFTEDRNSEPGITVFLFEAGQTCFNQANHRVSLDRPALFVVRDGDWRGNDTGFQVERTADDWVDEFANHQSKLSDVINQG